jgi:hypothetical protein
LKKALFVEKLMHAIGQFGPDAIQRPVLVGAGTQVGDGAQVFIRVPFLLQRIARVRFAQNLQALGP